MKQSAFFAIAIISMLILAGCTSTRYSNPMKGFSTIQPPGWSAYEDEMRVIFTSPDAQSQISIMAVYSQENATLASISYSVRQKIASGTGVSVISESERPLNVSGEPALEQALRLSQMVNRTSKETLERFVYLKKGGRYFIISLVLPASDSAGPQAQAGPENAFETVVSGFKLI